MAKGLKKKLNLAKTLRKLFPAFILILIFIGVFLLLQNKKTEPVFEDTKISAAEEASSSAKPTIKTTPSPSPKEIPAPIISGKTVRVPILTYHYIGYTDPEDKSRGNLSVTPENFDKQLNYLQTSGYTPISLDTMYASLKGQATLPSKPVILTFDDGYIDFYVNAYPILKKYGFHATSFIPTGLIGQSYYLKWDQIRDMDSSGLISFQSHSVTHAHLPSIALDKLRWELAESKKMLENSLGKPVNFIAYPFGASNNLVLEETKKAGYLGGLTTVPGTIISEGTTFYMPRIKIPDSWTIEQFAKNL